MKTKHSLRETLDIIKYTNAPILRVLEKDMSESKTEEKFNEKIAENFPNLMKYIYLHIQEARETLSRINSRRFIVETSQYKQKAMEKIENLENRKMKNDSSLTKNLQ